MALCTCEHCPDNIVPLVCCRSEPWRGHFQGACLSIDATFVAYVNNQDSLLKQGKTLREGELASAALRGKLLPKKTEASVIRRAAYSLVVAKWAPGTKGVRPLPGCVREVISNLYPDLNAPDFVDNAAVLPGAPSREARGHSSAPQRRRRDGDAAGPSAGFIPLDTAPAAGDVRRRRVTVSSDEEQ